MGLCQCNLRLQRDLHNLLDLPRTATVDSVCDDSSQRYPRIVDGNAVPGQIVDVVWDALIASDSVLLARDLFAWFSTLEDGAGQPECPRAGIDFRNDGANTGSRRDNDRAKVR